MQSSNHIGKIVRQHAEAVESGKSASRKRKSKSPAASAFTTVPKHRAFVPMITIWGGLLLALVTAVMPDQAIARASSLTGVYLPLLVTRLILATTIGLAGALLGYIVAKAVSNRAKMIEGDGVLVSTFKSRDLQPINPTADLGSESFDAPIVDDNEAEFFEIEESEQHSGADNEEPKLGELAKRGYDIEAPEEFGDEDAQHKKGEWAFTRKHFKSALIDSCEGATCEAAPAWENAPAPETGEISTPQNAASPPQSPSEYAALTAENSAPKAKKPRSLDLDEFGTLPGREGVWVEERPVSDQGLGQVSQPERIVPRTAPRTGPGTAKGPALRAVKGTVQEQTPASALEKLRQNPPEDLSLAEMVERFAAALHDHQAIERKRIAEGQIARESALAEALKALSLFTEAGFDHGKQMRVSESQIGQTEGELRGALERLQQLRGAA